MTTVLTESKDGVGFITLNRPERMNAITVELGTALENALVKLGEDGSVNAIVIRGAGQNFCAGGDFAEVERLRSTGGPALRLLFVAFRRACEAIATLEVPIIAAVEGVAMAGGFELMQAADIVLVSDGARIADNHINFGMIPGGGSTQRLPNLVGRQQAMALLLSGDRISGADAVRLGLAYRSFPVAEFEDSVWQFASDLAARPRAAVTTIKRLVNVSLDSTVALSLDREMAAVVAHINELPQTNGVGPGGGDKR